MVKMAFWSTVNFQNGVSNFMMSLDWFHSYVMIFLLMILFVVSIFLLMVSIPTFIELNQIEFQILEFFWTLIPGFFLLFIGFPSLDLLYKSEHIESNPLLSLKVVGHQWYWSYEYSDFSEVGFDSYMVPSLDLLNGSYRLLEVDNRVILPFNVFIRFIISSADVLHSWAVPSLGVKVDANPGRLNQICNMSNFPQVLYGQCSEICGANHSFMPIVLEFSSLTIFEKFLSILQK